MVRLQRLAVAPAQIQPPQVMLTPEQRHYLQRVLRLRQGDQFVVLDGQGHWWLTELQVTETAATDTAVTGRILEAISVQTELPISLTLVVALPKASGFDEVVRQSTELGVTYILPVISDRTVLHPSSQKVERWRRIIQEAAEQSERQLVPTLLDPIPFQASLHHPLVSSSLRLLCVTRRSVPHLLTVLSGAVSETTLDSILLAIGPEGGWTDAEIEQAIAARYRSVSLGSRILRTVTAPMVALAMVAGKLEAQVELGLPTADGRSALREASVD